MGVGSHPIGWSIPTFAPLSTVLIVNLKIEFPNGVLAAHRVISSKSSFCPSTRTNVTSDRNANQSGLPTDPVNGNSLSSESSPESVPPSMELRRATESEPRGDSIDGHDRTWMAESDVKVTESTPEMPIAELVATSAEIIAAAPMSNTEHLNTEHLDTEPVNAHLIGQATATPASQIVPTTSSVKYRSWIFRLFGAIAGLIQKCFGGASLVGCLAVATSVPGLQILTLGYLIESSGRVGRTGKVRSGLPGLNRAAHLGSMAVGTLIFLLPLLYVSQLVEAARLIEPTSSTVLSLRFLQSSLWVVILPHLITVWFCGGKLRYFFWPLLAPYQLSIWALRWILATRPLRSALDETLGQIWPAFVNDLCLVRPLTDFFVPAILMKHLWRGTLYRHARDGFWSFLGGLHLLHLTRLGLQTIGGSVAWLFIPTLLLIGGTMLPPGPAVLSGLVGIFTLSIVAMYLPLLQMHFGTVGQMYALFDIAAVFRLIRKSPLRITLSCILFLASAIPLYALKIEQIDDSLTWILGLVFILFSLPARLLVAWSYTRADHRETPTRWFWRWPVRGVMWPAALFFAGFVSITRFTSWGGAAGLFEQHAFLIPAPFLQWLS